MPSVFPDIFEQTQLTEFFKREYQALARQAGGGTATFQGGENRTDDPAATILPMKTVNGRHMKIRYQDITPVGMAQFKAPGATPALWTHKPNLREKLIELVDIDEFHRVDPIDMLRLKSPDPNVMKEAHWSLGDRGADLTERNELRTQWMRWEALKGTLVVTYPNSAAVTIGYGIPGGHFPTFGTAWTDVVNSNPVEDLWALSAVSLNDAGLYLSKHHLNSTTFRYVRRNQKIINQLSTWGREVMLVNEKDFTELLREGSNFKIVDSGYLVENQSDKALTKWIADGKIFSTPQDYSYAGRDIGMVGDGWVLVGGPTTADQPIAKQGQQSEWVYNRIGQQTLVRVASARMPRIDAPEALAWGTAY